MKLRDGRQAPKLKLSAIHNEFIMSNINARIFVHNEVTTESNWIENVPSRGNNH
jgi:hypothetical protein